ncbi:MAG TPA: Ig domain-containing protein [Kofleriaceae bacterium]|nr:Ig domain-containing protein [Kofleriaceae bacterium]
MRHTLLVVFALSLACAGGQAGPVQPGSAAQGDDHYVHNLRLTNTRGEVGRPFTAEITWEDNYLTAVEISASGLPPGLSLDQAKRVISGTPTRAGFFTVELAVRKHVDRERLHKPSPDERWWPARQEIEIYTPMK